MNQQQLIAQAYLQALQPQQSQQGMPAENQPQQPRPGTEKDHPNTLGGFFSEAGSDFAANPTINPFNVNNWDMKSLHRSMSNQVLNNWFNKTFGMGGGNSQPQYTADTFQQQPVRQVQRPQMATAADYLGGMR
jgi:hypothetical protein